MSDRDAFLRAIIANPDEDTPRLAFADWLDEHGDARDRARALYIRLSINRTAPWNCAKPPKPDRLGLRPVVTPRCRCAACAANRPLEKLEAAHRDRWEAPVLAALAGRLAPSGDRWRGSTWMYHGFVAGVLAPAYQFVAVAGALFSTTPIRSAGLLGAAPAQLDGPTTPAWLAGRYVWQCDDIIHALTRHTHLLPPALFDAVPGELFEHAGRRLKVYKAKVHATAALDVGCLAYGRRERDRVWEAASRDA